MRFRLTCLNKISLFNQQHEVTGSRYKLNGRKDLILFQRICILHLHLFYLDVRGGSFI